MRKMQISLWQTLKLVTVFSAIFALFALSSCRNEEQIAPEPETKAVADFSPKVITEWNNLFLEIERYARVYRPCPVARMLGYVGLAAYESVVIGMPEYQSIASRYQGLEIPKVESGKEYHYPTVLNAVYGSMFRNFFAQVRQDDLFKIAALEASLENTYSSEINSDLFNRSRAYGKAVAEAVWKYSATDVEGHNKYLDARPSSYTPPTGAGKWKPTAPGNEAGMFPYWGKARTFAISEAEKVCRQPLPYSEDKNSPYYAQGLEIYSLTTPQSYETQWIAEFWSDDVLNFTFSPPSRFLAIANQAVAISNANLEKALMASMKVGLALNDASVGCWNSKYFYNVERPTTYINKIFDANWNVESLTSTRFLKSTPSFPAYPSGHSTFGAAAAEALNSEFGYNFAMTDRCHENRSDFNGKPRSFGSFDEMALENALSRIYLGVHWRMDCEEGVRYGKVIGRKVNQLPFKKGS